MTEGERVSSAPIPFSLPDLDDDDVGAVVRVLRSGWLTTGEECLAFERELSTFLGAPHVIGVASCTQALEIVFSYLGLGPGARVAVPTWTFVASALAPAKAGVIPVLVDIDPGTLNVSTAALERALEGGVEAVVVVHFGGVPVDPAVHALCAAAGVPVVEDAAHAFGTRDHRGLVAGQGSIAACYSFYATKNLTCGEGGAIATEDEALDEFSRSFRLHGLSGNAWERYRPGNWRQYDLVMPGMKANLPDLLAALGRTQLARFEEMKLRRRALVVQYRSLLAEVPGLQLVPDSFFEGSADHLMTVLLPEGAERAHVQQHLASRGIGTSVHFRPLHTFKWFAEHARIGPGGTPVADALSSRALSLPLYPGLNAEQVDRVCAALAEVTRKQEVV